MFRAPSERPAPVRFASGFERFEQFVLDQGNDPGRLARDVSALWTFLAEHPEALESPELARAAAIFAGNAVAVAHPAATWKVRDEPEIGTRTRSIPVENLVLMMVEHPERRDGFVGTLETWDQEDQDEAEREALDRDSREPVLVLPPEGFERPPFPQRTYVDEHGNVIEYGTRWPLEGPPHDAYSRVSNPDRFAPLLLDVDALVDHLQRWYEVDVRRSTDEDGTKRVHLRPSTGSSLTITGTAEYVRVTAGALYDVVLPDCSCDACDETAESEAGRLEDTVLAIAGGGLQERYPLGRRRWLHTRVVHIDGGWSGGSGAPGPDRSAEQLEQAAATLRSLDDGWWPAWTLRAGAESVARR
ncbi:DUF6226 family protein [Amnibacterium kyonggiense]|uniref:DUF6226 family protein n=1 Tax=Amnibacterium kyonggiense TaxID=595671 RepID=UPI00105E528D|nr:DUF6226 family protein [Amnibacterium kyonggiense]